MKTKRPIGAERPFPWRCRHCSKKEVFMTAAWYGTDSLDIPVCRACGAKVFTEKVDEQINKRQP